MDRTQPASGRADGNRGPRRAAWRAFGWVAAGLFLLLFQNYGCDVLPDERIPIPPEQITPYGPEKSFAYAYPYDLSKPDDEFSQQSRVRLVENGRVYPPSLRTPEGVVQVGGNRYTHAPGQVIFASTDNTDPRSNGRTYEVLSPRFYTRAVGVGAALLFAGLVGGLYWWKRGATPPAPVSPAATSRWRWHLAGAALLLLAGLYCNTGTLSPYAITYFPKVNKATGYLYNEDHVHFRVLFDFVDGQGRTVWDKALFLRRILFPVLGWPLMKTAGFEVGGTIASLILNVGGFVAVLVLLRRRIGERGAVFAGWLLALYPGATYWGGLPYPYALIFPGSLLLMIGALALDESRSWRTLGAVSLAMGAGYLGYDLIVFFLPASVLVLLWRRRWTAALVSGLVQALPLGLWILYLGWGLHQPLKNSNTAAYGTVAQAFLHLRDLGQWWSSVSDFADVGLDVFFAANFLFLPALFVAVVALNPLTAGIRFRAAEVAVLLVGLGLFLLNNLAPPYGGSWVMRGTWIARLYQPVFPALIVFLARWWQALPPLNGVLRRLVLGAVAAAAIGNGLIVFGPILNDPLQLSGYAFYRFYNDTDDHLIYRESLQTYGRRPLGFPRPQS